MTELMLGIFWSVWTVYMAVQAILNTGERRIGNFLSACLAGLTSYFLLN